MTEPTPPAERPLSDEARARIRTELLTHAHDNRSSAPRWLVPAGAAAAVVLVAGLTGWAISSGSSDPESTPVASGGSSSAPVSTDPSTDTSTMPTKASEPIEVATGTCPEELPNVLPGAEPAFDFPAGDDGGTTSFFTKGDRFVLCDIREGVTTVQQPMPLTPRDDATTYAVSTLSLGGPGHRTIRVGGGLVPAGLEESFDVAYTFPDGHIEKATKATDDERRTWWRMVYAHDDGGGNEMDKAPIEVTVSYSGVQKHYSLGWGLYTCAQANHGC